MRGRRGRAGLLAAAVLLGMLAVAGCGRKGSPEAPGPGDQITYPRSYPTQ